MIRTLRTSTPARKLSILFAHLFWVLRTSFHTATRLAGARSARIVQRTRLHLQMLEERTVPSTYIWTPQNDSTVWSNAKNWTVNGAPAANEPGAGDVVEFDGTRSIQNSTDDDVSSVFMIKVENSYSGKITLSIPLNVTGGGYLKGGNINGSFTISQNSTLTINPGFGKAVGFGGGQITNDGTIDETSGFMNLSSVVFLNEGIFNITNNGQGVLAPATVQGQLNSEFTNSSTGTLSVVNVKQSLDRLSYK